MTIKFSAFVYVLSSVPGYAKEQVACAFREFDTHEEAHAWASSIVQQRKEETEIEVVKMSLPTKEYFDKELAKQAFYEELKKACTCPGQVTTKKKIESNLSSFLGKEWEKSFELSWGELPQDQLKAEVEEGMITSISFWSGLKWTMRGGMGSPSVKVTM